MPPTAPTADGRAPVAGPSRLLAVSLLVPALAVPVWTPTPAKLPNVILVSIDTLRADHLGCYGYPRDTTPRIDAWAKGAVRFDQATAPANSTLPSHMSLFTSLHPEAHGVVDREEFENQRLSLAEERVTLAETMRKAGYETAAFVRDCAWMDPGFGFDQGFDSYRVLGTDARQSNGEAILPWLRLPHEKPFFLFVHYYDVHSDWEQLPYDAPAPFDSRFTANYEGTFTGCGDGLCATSYLLDIDDSGKELPKEDLDFIEGLYDNGVAYTDSEVGRLLDALRDLGMRDDSIVVLVSDHGEEFREHGCLGHCALHQASIRVPWIVSWPRHLAPRAVNSPVQTLDLMPTLLQLLGLPANHEAQGISRVSELLGREGVAERALFSSEAWGSRMAVRRGRWKLILDLASKSRELYDLETDPDETVNLATTRPELASELANLIYTSRSESEGIVATAPPSQGGAPSADETAMLRSLGYLR